MKIQTSHNFIRQFALTFALLTAIDCGRAIAADSPPNEDFLLFIADLEQQDQQWISPLDFNDENPVTDTGSSTDTSLDNNEENDHD